MAKLLKAYELKLITKQHMTEEAKGLLTIIATSSMERAIRGSYSFTINTGHMEEIRGILERKGYKIRNLEYNDYEISWD